MTRKDYVKIAAIIKDIDTDNTSQVYRKRLVAEKIAEVLAEDSPRFDRDKFLSACGVV